MKRTLYIFTLILILIASLTQVGCTGIGSSEKPAYIVVGIDRTGSTGAMTTPYGDYSSRLFESLKTATSGVTVMAEIISDRPLTKSDFKVRQEIPAKQFSELDWQFEDRLEGSFNDLSAGINELLTRPVNYKGTHILDFITLAAGAMPKESGAVRQIWLFTDGFEENDYVNFYSEGMQLNSVRIEEVINKTKADGLLPDLTGIDLYIIGAGSGDYANESTEVYSNVKSFWVAYVAATGANLCKYGPALDSSSSCGVK